MQRRNLLLSTLAAAALGLPAWPGAQPTTLELNRASRAELESLPGIGPALATRLLAVREQALFADWGDLRRRVKGVGDAGVRRLSAQGLRVNGAAYPGADPGASTAAPPAYLPLPSSSALH